MAKIKLEGDLYDRARKVSETAGYSSVDEFVSHVLEKELRNIGGSGDTPEDEEKLKERLKGLGYIS
jgi:hypothetical protein